MKKLTFILLSLIGLNLSAQQGMQTSTFTVRGNCEECKVNIENAADIKGVKLLIWNQKTKVASVTYSPDKVTLQQIQEAIAKRGYDAGDIKGSDKAYKSLPKCCKYRDQACEEPKK